ncbi:hypothetical protein L3X38_010647 [Prunus dulcis]|uniref:Uncharacterized protein n=1 Tax=Prunus dulcis TaxID=3755 RepID=A0AAD4ZEM3_PRUDU|nr:hypothetical protein L3X38_010647 [Prunus dulcis]
MSKNFNFNKTEFKGNNMKKESYEGSRLGSARSGSAAELSQLLAGGRKTENWNEPPNWGTNSQPARTVDNLKTRTSVISPTRADYPIKGLQQHPVKDAPGSDSSKYLKYPYPSSKSGEERNVLRSNYPIWTMEQLRETLGQPTVKLPNSGQPGPRDPRPPFYNPKVPKGSTSLAHSPPHAPAARGCVEKFRKRKNSTPELTLPTLASARARTRKKEEKPYLNHRVWAAEAAARRRASPGSNQSSSRPEFVVSDGGKRPRLDRDVEADRSGPVSGPAVAGAAPIEERES